MQHAPVYEIDLEAFWQDPYPDLRRMRRECPVAFVPQLGAVLLTRRDDIFENEKKTDIFSSDQPEGLMQVLMGQNLMRKDGEAHAAERKAIFPALSPRSVNREWRKRFEAAAADQMPEPDDRVFLMFSSASRDEKNFARPDDFDLTQNTLASVAFGAGPHYCAGAAASRCLIAEVAMPRIFDRLTDLQLAGEVEFGGWAFRGPLSMPVAWS